MTLSSRVVAVALVLALLLALVIGNMSNPAVIGCGVAVLISAVAFLGIGCYLGIVYWLNNRENP